ncbi:MAG: carbon starvation CstA family protein [Clostridia bacterium]|nr:carbon starvation CstA family protein [Clostridia bacterium]
MNGLIMMIIAIIVLGGAYLIYGRYLANLWGIDENAKTPAYEMEDGVDYVPADTNVVFGHQFASIAGAGPINGPIQAAIFGWVPVLLWILIGGVFFGAVQDFASMYASVKNKGRTIGYIIELYIGKIGKKLFMLFTWLFSILVVAAFADVVCKTFNGFSDDGTSTILANGQVAMTSCLFIVAAVGLGMYLRKSKANKWINTIVAIAILVVCIAVGLFVPIYIGTGAWHIIVFIYIAIASIAPVWILLQPRDYLNSYLLVAMIVASVVGVLIANPTMELQAFNGWNVDGQTVFPYLFVTIACGAVSGFHSLVSSGTASKQIKNEKNMLPVSFGAMLMESMLAVIALIAVGAIAKGGVIPDMTQPVIFATGVAGFLVKLGIPESISMTLITLAVSAFALTSLDSVARIGRLAFEEFFLDADTDEENMSGITKVCTNKYFSTFITLAVAFALAKVGYKDIWPLFGSANQLLSALALIACAVFFKKTNRQGWMLWIPMIIMLLVTLSMLCITIYTKFTGVINATTTNMGGDILQLAFAVALFILGIIVSISGLKALTEKVNTAKA